MSNNIKEKVNAAQKLFDREVIINNKGDTDKGNNYSEILGIKVLKQIDSILKMFKDFDGAFVGIDLKDNSAVFIGNSAQSIDTPDTIGIKLDYIFKDIKPDLIISMYKEAGIKKIFEKALDDVVKAGFITTKEKKLF